MGASTRGSARSRRRHGRRHAWNILRAAAAILITFFLLAASCGPTREPALGQSAAEPSAASDPPSGNLGSPSSAGSLSGNSGGTSAPTDSISGSNPASSPPASNPANSASTSPDPTNPPTSASQPPSTTLSPEQQRLAGIEARVSTELAALERRAAEWLPHATFGIAVQPLEPAGNLLGLNENEGFVSASAAKPFWMVSTIAAEGIAAAEPYASAILCLSDNAATAAVIDATGIDPINEFLHNTAGMSNTFLLSWSFGSSPPASEQWMRLGRRAFNTTTASDGAAFYGGLYSGKLLEAEDTEAMLGWMAESSDCGQEFTKPLASRLPDGIRIWHKSGWLPPSCCTVETATLNDFGIVRAPASVTSAQSEIAADAATDATDTTADTVPDITYAIAIATSGGAVSYTSYLQQSNFMAYAACRIYAAVTSEPSECDRPEDREVTDPGSPPTTLPPTTSSSTTSVPATSSTPTFEPAPLEPQSNPATPASEEVPLPPTSSPPATITQQTAPPASPETSPTTP